MNAIRTRFAPSPTGYLHVGGLRTALYAYLLAKKHGGQFLLRIEDTDQTRLVEGATENIIEALRWAGIDFDEGPGKGGPCGPYIQSHRLEIYMKHALELIAAGHAYHCFCSSERLDELRARQTANKLPPAYDKHCRNLSPAELEEKLATERKSVIRMKVPLEGEMTFSDLIRGPVTFGYKVVDDQVLIKSDGFPTYHLAVVIDDHYMKISHVIRGEEWLSSTPKHILLYEYFGWDAPQFAHLPLLLNSDRSKLSKRQGDVAVEDYRQKGYLPEALVNFIAFLGWNPGDTREFFTLEELIKEFSLACVGKAGAIFNLEKLDWLNGQYIQRMPTRELVSRIKPLIAARELPFKNDEYLEQVVELLKERVTVLPDFLTNGAYFFDAPTHYDTAIVAKAWQPDTAQYIKEMLNVFESIQSFDAVSLEHAMREYTKNKNITMGRLIQPLRLALSGVGQGPSLYHMMALFGKEETRNRCLEACRVMTL
ncbi:MAG: glutamyl-tRNA synthetase [Candidatus Dependentiae bacterium]|nr:glutamyl-tRNA synthetase [Candidatus Dependentiae bacterium]